MKYYNAFLQNLVLRRWTVLFMLASILFLFRSLMTILLLTFIFTYLIYRLVLLLHRKSHLPIKLTSILTYSLIVFILYLVATNYVPIIIKQSVQLVNSVADFYQRTDSNNELIEYVLNLLQTSEYIQKLQSGVLVVINYLYNFGELALTVLISFLLSFFFMIDNKKTVAFSRLFLQGRGAWFFEDVYYLGAKFTRFRKCDRDAVGDRLSQYSDHCFRLSGDGLSAAVEFGVDDFLSQLDSCCWCDHLVYSIDVYCLFYRRI